MIDVALLVGKLILLGLLYLFVFFAVRAGLGLVRGRRDRVPGALMLAVERGPRELAGVKLPIAGPVVIGRSPGADIVIGDDFVSGRHARVSPAGDAALLEDLDSTNGTIADGRPVTGRVTLKAGSVIDIGSTRLKVVRG